MKYENFYAGGLLLHKHSFFTNGKFDNDKFNTFFDEQIKSFFKLETADNYNKNRISISKILKSEVGCSIPIFLKQEFKESGLTLSFAIVIQAQQKYTRSAQHFMNCVILYNTKKNMIWKLIPY